MLAPEYLSYVTNETLFDLSEPTIDPGIRMKETP
jgi:hypothetical protein